MAITTSAGISALIGQGPMKRKFKLKKIGDTIMAMRGGRKMSRGGKKKKEKKMNRGGRRRK